MTYISSALRRQVYQRATGRCEYCLLPEQYTIKRHEVDHVYAEKHGGATVEANLCLCCAICNRYKGSDIASLDPKTNEPVFLFHPRREVWTEHFRFDSAIIVGLTPQGRATARLFHMNDDDSVDERARLIKLGRYPAF